jgi:small nuclear ribonucleoprotein (snRNP)-like protein
MAEDGQSEFDRFVVRNAQSADPTSPINYVHALLGKRLCVVLMDQRLLTGIFVCLDKTGQLFMTNTVEDTEGHQRELGKAVIPLAYIQAMELRESE